MEEFGMPPSCIAEQEAPVQETLEGSLSAVAMGTRRHWGGKMWGLQETGIG